MLTDRALELIKEGKWYIDCGEAFAGLEDDPDCICIGNIMETMEYLEEFLNK